MKVWNRPCDEDCIVKAICKQPCYKLVRYANILVYEMAINPEVAKLRHPIMEVKLEEDKPMNWVLRIVDLINLNNHVIIEAAYPNTGGLTPFTFNININKYEFLTAEDQDGDEQED